MCLKPMAFGVFHNCGIEHLKLSFAPLFKQGTIYLFLNWLALIKPQLAMHCCSNKLWAYLHIFITNVMQIQLNCALFKYKNILSYISLERKKCKKCTFFLQKHTYKLFCIVCTVPNCIVTAYQQIYRKAFIEKYVFLNCHSLCLIL